MKKVLSLWLVASLTLLWLIVISRTYIQKDIILSLDGVPPYGCSLDQLKIELNNQLKGSRDIALSLKDFFEATEQYHSVEVRCTTPGLCHIQAQRSSVLAHTPQGQLFLETPIRLSPNPYGYESNILLDTPLTPNHDIAELCKNIHKGLFFDHPESITLQIFADQTVFMQSASRTPALYFWPIKGSEIKWRNLQNAIDKPLTSFVSCDMRYVSGGACELKKNQKSSKR